MYTIREEMRVLTPVVLVVSQYRCSTMRPSAEFKLKLACTRTYKGRDLPCLVEP